MSRIWIAAAACALAACGAKKQAAPDRESDWADIVRLAAPSCPPGDAASVAAFAGALDRIPDGNPLFVAIDPAVLDGLVAWAKGGGGIPRDALQGEPLRLRDTRVVAAMAGLRKRDTDDARTAALYLGWRLRCEGTSAIDLGTALGPADAAVMHDWPFDLVRAHPPLTADVVRGVAVRAVQDVAARPQTKPIWVQLAPALRHPIDDMTLTAAIFHLDDERGLLDRQELRVWTRHAQFVVQDYGRYLDELSRKVVAP
jgi:hypothetical protein